MLPALQRVSAACHAAGCLHGFASDGNLWPVAEDAFRNSGVDFYYEIDRRTEMDLRRLRETFPRLTLMGGIASETLHRGTREEVIQETLSALEVAREHGSIIVGCSNQIVCQTPPENVEVMMETLQAWR
jgi:uroporphyrinogen-III decarboxylase